MPIRRRAFSGQFLTVTLYNAYQLTLPAWNYLTSTSNPSAEPETTTSDVDTISLYANSHLAPDARLTSNSTYSMNILQHLPESKHGLVLVTLNPPFPPDPSKVVASFRYEHPMMTNASVASQSLLHSIQGQRGISFAGAWTKYGFHEDGFTSAFKLLINAPFNVKPPFPLKPASRTIKPPTTLETAGRLVVGSIERARRVIDRSGVWALVGWYMVFVLLLVERVGGVLGQKTLSGEAKRLRGYWAEQKLKIK